MRFKPAACSIINASVIKDAFNLELSVDVLVFICIASV